MSEVWAGQHVEDATQVAIKLLSPRAPDLDRTFRDALRNEVLAHARLDHPSIVRVLDFGEVGGELVARGCAARSPYLVTELAAGGTLAKVGFPLPLAEHRAILMPILAALAHAHARGVIHRDLKPTNVLFSAPRPGGRPQLCDFGIASAVRASTGGASHAPIRAGTPRFMAPEQVLERAHDEGPHTDLYALGCLAYVLACGRAPFDGDPDDVMRRHVLDPPAPPGVALPAAYAEWIATLLAKEPASRFASAAHAARALAEVDFDGPLVPASRPARRASVPPAPDFRGLRPSRWPVPELPSRHDRGISSDWLGAEAERRGLPTFAGLGLFGLRTVPLAARESEKDALFRRLADVVATRRPRIVLVTGSAGVGKTRLVEWLRERVVELGIATPLVARFSRERGPTEGFGPMLARALRLPSQGDPRARIEAWLEETGLPSAIDADDLVALVRGRDERFARPADRHAALRRALARLAERGPVVLHLDDGCRSPDAIAFLESLVAQDGLPILAVVTARDGDVDARARALAQGPLGLELRLAPLDPPAHARLVEDLLGLEGALADEVARRTAGNPLFAVQVVRDWVARQALVPGVTGFRLRDGVEPGLPDDVHAHFRAQLGRTLDRAVREPAQRLQVRVTLELGALLGAVPDEGEWSGVAEQFGAAHPREAVSLLLAADLGRVEGARFTFAHDLVRESLQRAAAESSRLAPLHLGIADELSRHGRDAERIATHYLAAADEAQALPHVLRTVSARLLTGDFAAVQAWARRAHELLDACGAAPDDARRAEVDIARVEAFLSGSLFDAAEALMDELAQRAAGQPTTLARTEWARGVLLQKRGEVREANEHFRRAEALGDPEHDTRFFARAAYGRAECEKILGQLATAKECYLRAGELFARVGENEGRVLSGLADLARREGDVDAAIALSQRADAHFAAAGMRYHVAITSNILGDLERGRGRPALARSHYDKAIAMLSSFGSEDVWIVRLNLALLDQEAGEHARSEALLLEIEAGLGLGERAGYVRFARCLRLPCLVARGALGAYDALLDDLEPELSNLVDPDVLAALDRAAALLRSLPDDARADRIGAIADVLRAQLAR
jgi:serine/threonine protein kinase/tetratricopeptide (TPR) repeat protein